MGLSVSHMWPPEKETCTSKCHTALMPIQHPAAPVGCNLVRVCQRTNSLWQLLQIVRTWCRKPPTLATRVSIISFALVTNQLLATAECSRCPQQNGTIMIIDSSGHRWVTPLQIVPPSRWRSKIPMAKCFVCSRTRHRLNCLGRRLHRFTLIRKYNVIRVRMRLP